MPVLSLVENLFEKKSFTKFALQSECRNFNQFAMIALECIDVIYNPAYTYKCQLKTTSDQPLMHVKELDISPGFETQISVSPVLFSTTNEALRRFEPEQRGCYSGSGGYEVSSNLIQNLKDFFKARMFTRVSVHGVKSPGGICMFMPKFIK